MMGINNTVIVMTKRNQNMAAIPHARRKVMEQQVSAGRL